MKVATRDSESRSPVRCTLDRARRHPDVSEAWGDLWKTRSLQARNTLVEHYMRNVIMTARSLHRKFPEEVQVDDMMSAGVFGLMQAIEAYDPGRGVRFETYCIPRIRGAILDEIRNWDWVPRLVRARANKLMQAKELIHAGDVVQEPTPREVAEALRVPQEEADLILSDSSAPEMSSLSRQWFETDSGKDVREVDMIVDDRHQDAIEAVHRREWFDYVLAGFTRTEQLIIKLYYQESLTMKQIGQVIDRSESRVSQMHAGLLRRLRAILTPTTPVAEAA